MPLKTKEQKTPEYSKETEISLLMGSVVHFIYPISDHNPEISTDNGDIRQLQTHTHTHTHTHSFA